MRILIQNPSASEIAFLTAVGFTNPTGLPQGNCSYDLPPGWILQKLRAESPDSFLIDGRENIRAELLGISSGGGSILLPRTAYYVIENPGQDYPFLVLCRSRINGTLVIQRNATRRGAEAWLDRAYPDWRDPAKHWAI